MDKNWNTDLMSQFLHYFYKRGDMKTHQQEFIIIIVENLKNLESWQNDEYTRLCIRQTTSVPICKIILPENVWAWYHALEKSLPPISEIAGVNMKMAGLTIPNHILFCRNSDKLQSLSSTGEPPLLDMTWPDLLFYCSSRLKHFLPPHFLTNPLSGWLITAVK